MDDFFTIDWKNSCQVCLTDPVDLTAAPDMVDGVVLRQGDRVLVTAQVPPPGKNFSPENGIYEVVNVGTGLDGLWVRAADCNHVDEVTPEFAVFVESGEWWAHTGWFHTSPGAILGVDGLRIQRFSGLGRVTAGPGISICYQGAATSYKDIISVYGTRERIKVWNNPVSECRGVDIHERFVRSIHRYGSVADLPGPPVIVPPCSCGTVGETRDVGTLYFAQDSSEIYWWNGTNWNLIFSGSGGGGQGPPGTAATIAVGSVTTGTAVSVTNVGTPTNAIFDFVFVGTGTSGPPGTAATIAVGSVTTGTAVSVTNVGTPTNAVFDFVFLGSGGSSGPSQRTFGWYREEALDAYTAFGPIYQLDQNFTLLSFNGNVKTLAANDSTVDIEYASTITGPWTSIFSVQPQILTANPLLTPGVISTGSLSTGKFLRFNFIGTNGYPPARQMTASLVALSIP